MFKTLLRHKRILIIIPGILMVCCIIIICSAHTSASAHDKNIRYKYFKSIVIEDGDSLWSIATEYISEEYESINDYIVELKTMNQLDDDTIHSGQNIVIAYYSDERK